MAGESTGKSRTVVALRVAVVATYGLGGVGKTQLALAYAHRHEAAFSVRWWIRAASRLTIVADLALLAGELGLGVEADQEQTAARALAALERQAGWLLIYDDAQEPARPGRAAASHCRRHRRHRRYRRYRPRSGAGAGDLTQSEL